MPNRTPDGSPNGAGVGGAAARWTLVRDAVDGALALPPPARAAFLDAACRGDAALRAEAEGLVLACERADASGAFLAERAADLAAPLLAGGSGGSLGPHGDRGALPPADALRAAFAPAYDVERELGRGGMATVFLARDRKHGRQVALKLLHPELGAVLGAERFLAEIAVTARLQHPNIVPLFDSGRVAVDEGGATTPLLYYVMPYVAGESLRARLARERQLPVDEAVRVATAVAGALDHAHRQGVVHRDLKPENILLRDGAPMVADFGIAIAVRAAGGTRLTRTGISLGTPAYMSPEQASADRALDARSDIYSLACVLYEMLAGDPPHTGSTVHAVLARLLTEPPASVRTRRPSVPVQVDAAVDRALAKVPADRFATAREFAEALDAPAGEPLGSWSGASPATSRGRGARRRDPLVVGLALAAALGGGGAAWLWARRAPAPLPARFAVRWAPAAYTGTGSAPTLTPDGRHIVYVGDAMTGRAVYLRPLDGLNARAIAGTQDAVRAVVSRDGRWVAFTTADDKLKRVPIEGGTPTLVAGAFRYARVAWAADGAIVLETFGGDILSRVPAGGGAARAVTQLDTARGESLHAAPLVLPGGEAVVFTVERRRGGPGPILGDLAIARLDGGERGEGGAGTPARHTLLGVAGREAVAFVDGWLVYGGAEGTSLMAVRLDARRGRATGAPVPVLQDVAGGVDRVAVADDGTLLYTRPAAAANVLALVDAAGRAERVLAGGPGGVQMNPRLSPDGRRVAVHAVSPQGTDVWLYDVASGTPTRLTTTGSAILPEWTPDGRRVVFFDPGVGGAYWWQPADGSAPARRVVSAAGSFASSVAPDGRSLLFQRHVDGVWGLWAAALTPTAPDAPGGATADQPPRAVLREPYDNYMPALSPDGRWLAYASNASGRVEVYVRSYPALGATAQVSDGGGTEPVWSPDGGRLYYRGGGRLVEATLAPAAAGTLAVTRRAPLFADAFDGGMPHGNYAVAPPGPDGRQAGPRFVMVTQQPGREPETVVVLNWLTELRARLAAATR